MSILKDFCFSVELESDGDRVAEIETGEVGPLTVATPPEFRGGVHGEWSPEHLLVAATSSCYALTLASVAQRRELPLHAVAIESVGHVTRRADGRFGFVVIELAVEITTTAGFEDNVRRAARAAESGCLIANALSVPVEIELTVRTATPVTA
jgi:peroxiredoxin-like protein